VRGKNSCHGLIPNSHKFFCLFCRYRWIKNGKPFDWQAYDDRISQQPGRGSLVISSPRDEDLGECLFIQFKKKQVSVS
jgi:hypothetical protein